MSSADRITAIIASQFPETYETFVIRELNALADSGFPMQIYSLKKCRDRIRHPEAEALASKTVTLAWNDPAVWLRSLIGFIRSPFRALGSLVWVLRFERSSWSSFAKALLIWGQSLAIAQRMRKDGIGHIHAHWATMPTTSAVIISRLLDVPFSFTAHAWDIFVRNTSLREKIRLSRAVITCTKFNREALCELCPEAADKIHLNYHGVNIAKFASRSREIEPPLQTQAPPQFLSIGRFVEQKGYPDLVDAYRILKERSVPFTAIIIGEGPLEEMIKKRIADAGLDNHVTLTSGKTQQELRALYHRSYAFVLPCVIAPNDDRDGIPNVILEAMAAGLPIVSTTVSGVPEAVIHTKTGLCVSPHSPAELADALRTLIDNPEATRLMASESARYAEHAFSDTLHLDNLVGLMKEVVAPIQQEQRVRVAQLIWSLEVGGAERVAATIAAGLDRSNYEPLVICQNEPGRLAQQLEASGIPVIALHKKRGLDFGMLRELVRILRQRNVDILHAHLFGAAFWGRLASRLAGVQCVFVHEHGMQPWRGSLHFFIDRALAGLAQRYLFASEPVRDLYVRRTGVATEKCVVVANGVPCSEPGEQQDVLRSANGFSAHHEVIASVGRLSPEKDHANLIQAFSELSKKREQARLVLIGDGPERTRLEKLVSDLGLEPLVRFAGLQDDVQPWLAMADVYVQPSVREGLSLAILEAMGARLPVIATRVGDVDKVIDDGRTGFLVPPGNSHALAERMHEVLTMYEDLDRLRQAAHDLVQDRYSREAMVRFIERLYEEQMSNRGDHRLTTPR